MIYSQYTATRQILCLLLTLPLFTIATAQEQARIVYHDENGCLRYQSDTESNRISDFSHAGYHNGERDLPVVPVVLSITPVEGDNTAHVQAAIDQVSALPLDANGFRGALLLEAGSYPISGSLRINASGVVIRGVGQGEDPNSNTVIRGVGNAVDMRELIVFGAPGRPDWSGELAGTRSAVTSEFLPAGSRSIEVAAAELYDVGDNVIVFHPSTQEWLASINNGDTAGDTPWQPGEIDIYYNRYITDVNIPEGKITLDAPIFDHLRRSLAQAEVYVLNEPNQLREVGIENLRIFIETTGQFAETHVRTCIAFDGVEDAWIKEVTALHFIYALVDMRATTRATVMNCSALEPHSLVTGSRRYNFNVSRQTNNVLFTGCTASDGRHSFVSNGTSSASGIVWTNCTTRRDYTSSEGHRRWSQGLLFDDIEFIDPRFRVMLGLYNRGDYGTGHGWSTTNGVAWNVRMPVTGITLLHKPPGRQNFAIGGRGIHSPFGDFDHPVGYSELMNKIPSITSLYAAQLSQRMTKGTAPDAPVLTSANRENDGLRLEWLDIASLETGYVVTYTHSENMNRVFLDTLPANTTSYILDEQPAEQGALQFQVFALGHGCPSPFSNPIAVDFTNNVREATTQELRVIPNPVANELRLQTDLPLRSITVLDANSRQVVRLTNTRKINVSQWPPGTYFLRLETSSGQAYSTKFIKQ